MKTPNEILGYVTGFAILFWRDQENLPSGEELKRLAKPGEFWAGCFGYVNFGDTVIHSSVCVPKEYGLVVEEKKAELHRLVVVQLANAIAKICAETKAEDERQEIFTP